jgi:hypothetical protein
MIRIALGSSSKPLSNPGLILLDFFNLVLADTNQSTAAAAAQLSDANSHRYFITPPPCSRCNAGIMIAAGRGGP